MEYVLNSCLLELECVMELLQGRGYLIFTTCMIYNIDPYFLGDRADSDEEIAIIGNNCLHFNTRSYHISGISRLFRGNIILSHCMCGVRSFRYYLFWLRSPFVRVVLRRSVLYRISLLLASGSTRNTNILWITWSSLIQIFDVLVKFLCKRPQKER